MRCLESLEALETHAIAPSGCSLVSVATTTTTCLLSFILISVSALSNHRAYQMNDSRRIREMLSCELIFKARGLNQEKWVSEYFCLSLWALNLLPQRNTKFVNSRKRFLRSTTWPEKIFTSTFASLRCRSTLSRMERSRESTASERFGGAARRSRVAAATSNARSSSTKTSQTTSRAFKRFYRSKDSTLGTRRRVIARTSTATTSTSVSLSSTAYRARTTH